VSFRRLLAPSWRPIATRARTRIAQALGEPGISKKSFALAAKILEVEEAASSDERIVEVHPEVSFRVMAGHPIKYSKKSRNGLLLRR